jgi:hypothetical protein
MCSRTKLARELVYRASFFNSSNGWAEFSQITSSRAKLWHVSSMMLSPPHYKDEGGSNISRATRGHQMSWQPQGAMVGGGCSGYPKISGRVIRVFKISSFENWYPKLQRVLQYPKIRVPGVSGSGIPELPELLCWLHRNTYTLLN